MEERKVTTGDRSSVIATPEEVAPPSFMPTNRKLDNNEERLQQLADRAAGEADRFTGNSKSIMDNTLLLNIVTGIMGLSILAMAFAMIGANLLRTGAFVSPLTMGIVGLSGAVGVVLAFVNGQKKWAAGWMLTAMFATLTVVTVVTAIMTVLR